MSMKELMAAGNSLSSDVPNVEKVFSTYLYDGTGIRKSIDNGINLGDFGVGTSTEFDGTNDYLSRGSDLTGNADGKTFTISAWVYRASGDTSSGYIFESLTNRFGVYINWGTAPNHYVDFFAKDTGGTYIFEGNTAAAGGSYAGGFSADTWVHVMMSIDLTSTSNRHIYINDVDASAGTNWNTYTNSDIDFTRTDHAIGASATGGAQAKQRLAHVFLDHTYRDLSVEANRRSFIDANGGSTSPATLSALNPILYLPMTKAYTIGENLGTGGDFTATGSPTIIDKGTEYVVGSGDGGMVWTKGRQSTVNHAISDTERGIGKVIAPNNTSAEVPSAGYITSFNSDGWSMGGNTETNLLNEPFASWTFKKSPRFFDVVTYSGNSITSREIAHDLGVTPGFILIKNRNSASSSWRLLHRAGGNWVAGAAFGTASVADASAYGYMWFGNLDTTNPIFSPPTSTHFTVSWHPDVNGTSDYVAYLFAHDPDGENDDGMIDCGSFTTDANADATVTIGWEPQYILYKITSASASWEIQDMMRGLTAEGVDNKHLQPDTSSAEQTNAGLLRPTATGFFSTSGLNSNATYIYMAIRAPMMVEPEAGTEVFAISTADSTPPQFTAPFPVDMALNRNKSVADSMNISSRLTSGKRLFTDTTAAEGTLSYNVFDYMDGWRTQTTANTLVYSWMFKRAKGFFDVVAYTGNGTAGRTVNHSLGVAPEMMIVKSRSGSYRGVVYSKTLGKDYYLEIFSATGSNGISVLDVGMWNSTLPTDASFSLGSWSPNNSVAGGNYIAYLFATLPGVSKVGSYTGNGSSQNIACGFSGGARFVMIKRTDSTGDWYLWDTERGIVTGNDPHLSLNTTAAEVTSDDSVDPESAGFTVNQVSATNINVSSATYIFLAIA